MATSAPESRLRQIAILVASVDSTSARRILLNLPTEIAKKVRALAAEIGPISPEERKQLTAELQKVQNRHSEQSGQSGGLETNSIASVVKPAADGKAATKVWSEWPLEGGATLDGLEILAGQSSPSRNTDSSSPAWTRLSVDALLRFVRHERPTVIAVIVSQLSAVQAAAILQRLPRSLSRDVLKCFGNLQEIDAEVRQTIDDHLSQRLSEYRNKIETEVENVRRINELLAAAPPELKQQWASWLRPDVFLNEEQSTTKEPSRPAVNQAVNPEIRAADSRVEHRAVDQLFQGVRATASGSRAAIQQKDELPSTIPFQARNQRASGSTQPSSAKPTEPAPSARTMRSIDLEVILTLAPEQLAELLSRLDSQTILLALAGSSPRFMSRFNDMLEASDAKVLNERLQKIGPLQLRDIDEAQKRVIDAYWAMVGPMGLRLSA